VVVMRLEEQVGRKGWVDQGEMMVVVEEEGWLQATLGRWVTGTSVERAYHTFGLAQG
jgi:hypothetical protein